MRRLTIRFWLEAALGLTSAALLALTLVLPDWFEVLFEFEADAGDGTAEWALALTLAAVTVVAFALAGRTWHRRRHASSQA
jgi:hypothetical protein